MEWPEGGKGLRFVCLFFVWLFDFIGLLVQSVCAFTTTCGVYVFLQSDGFSQVVHTGS